MNLLLSKLIGRSADLRQVILGCGFPLAAQGNVALAKISIPTLVGLLVIVGGAEKYQTQ